MREYEEENQEDEDLTEWLKEGKEANDKLALATK